MLDLVLQQKVTDLLNNYGMYEVDEVMRLYEVKRIVEAVKNRGGVYKFTDFEETCLTEVYDCPSVITMPHHYDEYIKCYITAAKVKDGDKLELVACDEMGNKVRIDVMNDISALDLCYIADAIQD